MSDLAQIGVTGLAVMGRNLARNLARHGHRVAGHNRTYARTEAFMEEYGNEGEFVPGKSMADFVKPLEPPRRILIMVKAGAPTDAVIDELVPLLEMGDTFHTEWSGDRTEQQIGPAATLNLSQPQKAEEVPS